MPRHPPPQELIDSWAAQYNSGLSLRRIQANTSVSYGTVHRYVSRHPTVTMRGKNGQPGGIHPWNR
ncbi:helix-turn-helix domain-containing protein [Amycolatopsis sp. lyj-23]|uniref:helix-turn-helix domain-containing protein n=1 Tax=Amycolatopsis sp. lyj-23 TaxID=2789283 RepID=UPI00397CDF0A